MDNSSISSDEEACLYGMQLVTASVLPAALKCAVELGLLELIKKAGPGAFVSPAELAVQIPATNAAANVMLDRILRLLATNNILNCRLREVPDGGVERLYALGPVCKFLTSDDDGVSMTPLLLMNQDKIFMETWYFLKDKLHPTTLRYHLKDGVLEGGVPFNRAHGMSAFEYTGKDPRINDVFNKAMSQQSTLIMKKILEIYKGFEGLKSLVDVGGGIGASLKLIISKYPSIKGINFDLPHVVQHAPSHPGVIQVGGDMFVGVPKGDAIFMKWICHDWSDAHCLKVLKNCHEALPEGGKAIIAERILSEVPNKGLLSSLGFTVDVIMLAYNPGGKERTEEEFRALAKGAGFNEFRKVCCGYSLWIMEFYK